MNIELQKLTFSNMFSYGDNNVIELNKEQITQLSATNGSGKTAIALIIQELLFNKNTKGIKKGDIINRHRAAKTWEGSLDFKVGEDQYNISVKRTGATSKVVLLKDGVDVSEHKVIDTYKKITEILGLDFAVGSQLTYQSSKELLEFLKATDANRKKFLINLFNLEKYLTTGDTIKAIAVANDKELASLKTQLATINSFLESTTIEDKKEVLELPEVDSSLAIRISEIDKELANYNDTCKRIDKNNMYIKESSSLQFDIALKEPEPFEFIEAYQTLRLDIGVLNSEIAGIKKKKANIKLIDKCSTCGQSIDNSHQLAMAAELENELKSKELTKEQAIIKSELWGKQLQEREKALKAYADNEQKYRRFEQLAQLIDKDIATDYPNVSDLQTEKTSIKTTFDAQSKKMKDVIEHNNKVSAHNAKVEALTEQKDEFLIRHNELENAINNSAEKQIDLNTLKKAFSPTGIVAFKLENLTKELENAINSYLAELSEGQFQVEFSLEKEKLNIDIIDDGIKSPIETVSEGEFSRIQTSILLAIRTLLSKLGGNGINLLFLDEVTGVLDDKGKEELIEVLTKDTTEKLNVFLISHDFSHPLVPKIEIIKENKVSRIIN